tara:strand:- start:528 stop:1133 length:606 start_codon:yes stop_codon:yes gene_type:complete
MFVKYMRSELVILLVIGFLIFNTYHDGKYTKLIYKNKKYMQMAFYGIVGISLILLFRYNPNRCQKLLYHANDAIKYMPIDKRSADMLSPIIDFTTRDGNNSTFMGQVNPPRENVNYTMEQKILSSGRKNGKKTTKRSVSETKKKYVASAQDWKCAKCRDKLSAWFEVDHKTRLEYGGSNEVSNLEALCRECHGEKTAFENM